MSPVGDVRHEVVVQELEGSEKFSGRCFRAVGLR